MNLLQRALQNKVCEARVGLFSHQSLELIERIVAEQTKAPLSKSSKARFSKDVKQRKLYGCKLFVQENEVFDLILLDVWTFISYVLLTYIALED